MRGPFFKKTPSKSYSEKADATFFLILKWVMTYGIHNVIVLMNQKPDGFP